MSGTAICPTRAEGSAAIRSISTSVSFTSRPVVPTVVRGGGVGKNSRQTSSKAKKLLRSVWKTCAFTTDRKSTRLNSSHLVISYAVFCLKKKKRSLRKKSQGYI